VDDEPNLLSALTRILHERFDVVTAVGGEEGLHQLESFGPFAAVVSDMRMPGMDGAQFLARVRERAPDTMRLLLTGQADMAATVAAINHGGVHRFLSKPCRPDDLVAALDDAVSRYRLAQAERRLLETTLAGTVKTITDILAIVAPWSFRRAAFARAGVRHALAKLDWSDGWIYEVAAVLSQIGCVGLPQDVVMRDVTQGRLSPGELQMLADHPESAYKLILPIPRLESVAEIVRYQSRPPPETAMPSVRRGAELLRACLWLERPSLRSAGLAERVRQLEAVYPAIPDALIAVIADFRVGARTEQTTSIGELQPGWVVEQDVRTRSGTLILPAGHELTESAIMALRRMAAVKGIGDSILVSR